MSHQKYAGVYCKLLALSIYTLYFVFTCDKPYKILLEVLLLNKDHSTDVNSAVDSTKTQLQVVSMAVICTGPTQNLNFSCQQN